MPTARLASRHAGDSRSPAAAHRRFRYLPDQHDDRIRRSPRLTLSEMAIESFYPANARTAGYMRTRAEENKPTHRDTQARLA
jgi:hypothetical protein